MLESILRIGLGRGFPMLHKMLIFKRGIDFSLVRHQTLFPTLFLGEEGIPYSKRNLFQLELIPKFGISSWNQFRHSNLFKNNPSGLLFYLIILINQTCITQDNLGTCVYIRLFNCILADTPLLSPLSPTTQENRERRPKIVNGIKIGKVFFPAVYWPLN